MFDQLVAEMEVYDPATGTVEELARVVEPRSQHTATLLTDGRVLLAGGVDARGELVTRLEVWDPVSRTLETLPETLREGKKGHVARLLANGNVLVGGEEVGPGRMPIDSDDLKVAASLPLDGAKDAPVNRWVAVRFTRPAKPESLNTATVVLRKEGEAEVSAKVVAAEAGMLLFVTPLEPLAAGANYELSIVGAGSDSGAVMLPTTIRFQTAAAIVPDKSGERALGPVNPQTGEREELAPPPLQASAGVTALYGHVRTVFGRYLDNVTMRLECGRTEKAAVTDRLGRFLVTGLPAGHCSMEIDATTAQERGREYGRYFVGVDLVPGRTNLLPYTIWMTPIDRGQEVNIPSPTTRETVITHPRLRGLELRLPAGAVIRDYHGQVIRKLGITPIPINRPPFPLPKNVPVPVYFTIQPGGAFVEVNGSRYAPGRGAQLVYPNQHRAPAGRVFNFWDYDPDGRGWYVYGRGKVSANRKSIVPDPGVVIYRFSGAMVAGPPFAPPVGPGPDPLSEECCTGDPVDTRTGLFLQTETDVALPDTMPIVMSRTYRQGDHLSRAFGVGWNHPYEMFLVGDTADYVTMDLILPDGGHVGYKRISPGTSYVDAVLEHTGTQSAFYKSRISWNGLNWDLTTLDGTVMVFEENAFGNTERSGGLLQIKDRNGNTLTVTRERVSGRIQRISSPNGRWVQFTYDGGARVTQMTDNGGRNYGYEYDEGGRLIKATNPLGGYSEYTYDANNQMLTVKNPRGYIHVTNEYDASGRISKQTQTDGGIWLYAYTEDANDNVIRTDVTNPRGYVTRYEFNTVGHFSGGSLVSKTWAYGTALAQTVTYERNAATNFLSAVVDQMGRRTEMTYDGYGHPTMVKQLAGTANPVVTQVSYGGAYQLPQTMTNPLNQVVTLTYDAKGNVVSVKDPLNNTTSIGYNLAGQPISVTPPGLAATTMEYSGGLPTAVVNALGYRVSRGFDALGRMVSVTDALGAMSRVEYDALNRPVKLWDAMNAQTTLAYDANSNLTSLTDARSGVTAFGYDSSDQKTSRTDPVSKTETFEYNKIGAPTKATDRKSQVTNITYDALGRPTVVTFHDGSTVTPTYDAGNRITQVVDSLNGTFTYTYDLMDRVLTESGPKGSVTYTYDIGGRRSTMQVAGQAVVSYSYDGASRLTQIQQGSLVVGFGYDAAGRPTTLTLPNSVVATYSYDAASRLTGISWARLGVAIGNLTYEYDAAGRKMGVGGSLARTGLPTAVASASHNAANRLTSWNGTTLTYDDNGNMTSDGSRSFTWNARDQMTGISGAATASFQYDAGGRRLQSIRSANP